MKPFAVYQSASTSGGPGANVGVRPTRARFSRPATFVYVLLHLGCLGVLWTGVNSEAIAILCGAFLLRAVGVSIVYHRYFAHRSFRTSRWMQFLLGIYGATTALGGPLWWAQTHRDHHRHADTPDDIHSPHYQGFIYSHCGWFLDQEHRDVDLARIRDLARFPELVWLERWNGAFKLLYIGCCYWWFGVMGIVWGFFVPTVLVLQMIHWIQSVSHSLGGYRRFPTPDNSRNHWLFGVLSLGEGFHHNHHCFPNSARLGLRWWEFDAAYGLLVLLSWSGLIWDLRVPKKALDEGSDSRVERHVAVARAEIRDLGQRIDAALAAFDRELADEGPRHNSCRGLRRRAALHTEALAERARELLIAGSFVLQHAVEELRLALHDDARTTLAASGRAASADAAIERLDAAIWGPPPRVRAPGAGQARANAGST